ncbi:alcohol dehydrogenase [Erwinia sp. E_sp_B04_7]
MSANIAGKVVVITSSQPDEVDINEILYRPTSQQV